MTKMLEQAIAEVERLSETDREQIGRQLLSHVETLRRLRADLDKGLRSLDAGQGEPVGVEEFIEEQHARHAGS
jgi:hypothetical protein